MTAPPRRFMSLSQVWLPTLLFVLSVVSILFTLRKGEIAVIGPSERVVIDSSELESHRHEINEALQGSSSWQSWCEKPHEALASLRLERFHKDVDGRRWSQMRRLVPQRELDAWLRCQNTERRAEGPMHACLFLSDKVQGKSEAKQNGLHLLELTLELRAKGRKQSLSCSEALAAEQAVELVAWYTYYLGRRNRQETFAFRAS